MCHPKTTCASHLKLVANTFVGNCCSILIDDLDPLSVWFWKKESRTPFANRYCLRLGLGGAYGVFVLQHLVSFYPNANNGSRHPVLSAHKLG